MKFTKRSACGGRFEMVLADDFAERLDPLPIDAAVRRPKDVPARAEAKHRRINGNRVLALLPDRALVDLKIENVATAPIVLFGRVPNDRAMARSLRVVELGSLEA